MGKVLMRIVGLQDEGSYQKTSGNGETFVLTVGSFIGILLANLNFPRYVISQILMKKNLL